MEVARGTVFILGRKMGILYETMIREKEEISLGREFLQAGS
jgi:hypothetical protein